jgi:hypothetical protein
MAVPERMRLTISMRALLAIYAVIPLCLIVYALDRLALGGALRAALPSNPDHLFLFGLLFGWPHILASNVILVSNREYWHALRGRVLIASLVIIAFFGIGNFALPYILLSLVAATVTIIHVLKQQIGIGAGAARISHWLYATWGWTGIAAGAVMYNTIYLEDDLARYRAILDGTALALAAAVIGLAVALHVRIKTGMGKAFLWGNTAMVIAPTIFYFDGYEIFAIAIPRVIHDTTAFAFYVAHDHNKHREAPGNGLYRVATRLPGGIYWLSPVLAVALAFVLEEYGDAAFNFVTNDALAAGMPQAISLGLLGYFAMLHYYTESFTWKGGSPYRRHVSIKA